MVSDMEIYDVRPVLAGNLIDHFTALNHEKHYMVITFENQDGKADSLLVLDVLSEEVTRGFGFWKHTVTVVLGLDAQGEAHSLEFPQSAPVTVELVYPYSEEARELLEDPEANRKRIQRSLRELISL